MPSAGVVLLAGAVAVLVWTWLGYRLARWLVPLPVSAAALAPALGWAVFNATAAPLFMLVGFTPVSVSLFTAAAVLASIMTPRPKPLPAPIGAEPKAGLAFWVYGLAASLAIAPALAVMPKFTSDGVVLAAPIFDHSKVAIIDEIARQGMPPGNPFFEAGASVSRLAYYYLWHFSAAELALLPGVGGWAADAALTWFTAYTSLLLMMGLAVALSGRKRAAIWVAVLSLTATLRPVLALIVGAENWDRLLASGVAGWIVQASWVPQHLASASCVVLSALLLWRLTLDREWRAVPVLALVVAAGFESSTWVGGITFAGAAALAVIALLPLVTPGGRAPFLGRAAAAALASVVVALPFLWDQYWATLAREGGPPIALHPFESFGLLIPEGVRRALDLPGFWLVLLLVDLPAIYLAGIVGLVSFSVGRNRPPAERQIAAVLAAFVAGSLATTWLLRSTIGNNDLGWRAILPAVLLLTMFAAAGLSRGPARGIAGRSVPLLLLFTILFALGLPEGLRMIRENATGRPSPDAASFFRSESLWAAVRRHSGPADRVADNPLFLKDETPWPVNISWALLADRPSCYAGWETTRAYAALPRARIAELDAQFIRVFAGRGSDDDVRDLAERYRCRVVVLTAADGAWSHDPFAHTPFYRLMEQSPDAWRIYAATGPMETPAVPPP